MADRRKPKGGAGGGESKQSDAGLWIIMILVVLFVSVLGFGKGFLFNPSYVNLEYFFNKIANGFIPFLNSILSGHFFFVVGIVSSILSIFFIAIITFSLVRMREIQNNEKAHIDHSIALALARDAEEESQENPRWRYVLGLVGSQSESDWRIAIIECDSMLDEVLEQKGYTGLTVADKLKNAEGEGFSTIENAWEAHNIRNKIAHEGYDYPLSQLETRRVIRLFETVFEEFHFI